MINSIDWTSAGARPRILVATVLVVLAGALLLAAASPDRSAGNGATPTGYNPNDLPVASCFWTGPFTRSNPKTNLAYPGTEITYWGAKFITPPGAELTLKGRFPHARYSSLNAYIDNGRSSGSLRDRDIRPDQGSINPSIPGKNRSARNRSYTVTVLGEPKPDRPAPNTLYAEPIEGAHQDVLYRVYIPDRGRDFAGGTGIPTPSLKLEDGTVLTGQALCEAMNSIHDYTSQTVSEQTYYSNLLVNFPGKDPATNPAEPEFSFSKFFNLETALGRFGTRSYWEARWALNPEYRGTLYDNSDARYMTGAYSFDFGDGLAIHGRLPTTPLTLDGQKKTRAGQLVEWDLCVTQSIVTTRTYSCVFDEQIPLRSRKRNYVVLISKKEDRPSNAINRCGVRWLPADPAGDGAGRPNVGQLLTRNVIPSPDFGKSSWAVTSPFDAASIMGEFFPRGTYFSKERFESKGCPFRWK